MRERPSETEIPCERAERETERESQREQVREAANDRDTQRLERENA